MLTGLDQLSSTPQSGLRKRLRGGEVGVLTHAAAVDRQGRQTLEVLEELGITPAVVFSPEHGLDGVAQAEEPVSSRGVSEENSRKTISLYGAAKSSLVPPKEAFENLSLCVIDLCDIGTRFYTYVWTALLFARAASEHGVHCVILDRPNPLSGDPHSIEGKPQSQEYLSFVGLEPLPIRHALTLAEIVVHFMAKDGHAVGPEGAVSVVRTNGWERYKTSLAYANPFVPPSPNMPSFETALLYPGACLIEGTNLSEGRGTAFPFRVLGAPFLDGELLASNIRRLGTPGAIVRPVSFRPSFEKHRDEVCRGVMVHVTDERLFRPVATYIALITLSRQQAPDKFEFLSRAYEFEAERRAFDLLCGTAAIREAIENDAPPEDIADALCPVDVSFRELVSEAEALLETAAA